MKAQPALNQSKVKEFVGKVLNDTSAALVTNLAILCDRLGLFKDLAANGSGTSAEFAARTGINERYLPFGVSLYCTRNGPAPFFAVFSQSPTSSLSLSKAAFALERPRTSFPPAGAATRVNMSQKDEQYQNSGVLQDFRNAHLLRSNVS